MAKVRRYLVFANVCVIVSLLYVVTLLQRKTRELTFVTNQYRLQFETRQNSRIEYTEGPNAVIGNTVNIFITKTVGRCFA